MSNVPVVLSVNDLQVIEDEPRILDLDLARALGLTHRRMIRQVIKSNAGELRRHGILKSAPSKSTGRRGRPPVEFWLNEAQAVLVTMRSNAPRAADARAEIIAVFTAHRHGLLQPVDVSPEPIVPPAPEPPALPAPKKGNLVPAVVNGVKNGVKNIMPPILHEALKPQTDQHRHLYDKQIAIHREVRSMRADFATLVGAAVSRSHEPVNALVVAAAGYVELGGVYQQAGVSGRIPRRDKLSGHVTRSLDAYCKRYGYQPRSTTVGNREVSYWPQIAVHGWLEERGRAAIEAHMARFAEHDQTVIPFPHTGAR